MTVETVNIAPQEEGDDISQQEVTARNRVRTVRSADLCAVLDCLTLPGPTIATIYRIALDEDGLPEPRGRGRCACNRKMIFDHRATIRRRGDLPATQITAR